jgi:hypothetical protein
MAWQRWRESVGDVTRRLGRLGLVGGLLLGVAGCETVKNPFAPNPTPGAGASNVSRSIVVGEWEVTLIVTAGGDFQIWTTNWLFRPDNTCRFRQTIESTLEGTIRDRFRTCIWTESNNNLVVTYDDTGAVDTMDLEFPTFDADRMILQGVEYLRIN